MPYKDQVIHLSGGIHDYVGKLDQAEHKMGANWYRLIDPCTVGSRKLPNGQIEMGLIAIQGSADFYKRYIDIRIPEDSIIEIRTLDPNGDLMEAYNKEHVRKKSKIIQAPGISLPRGASMH